MSPCPSRNRFLLVISSLLEAQSCSSALLQGRPCPKGAFPHRSVSMLAWPAIPAPSSSSLQSPELVVLLCRASRLWCPGPQGDYILAVLLWE